jgi:hypothetical protein
MLNAVLLGSLSCWQLSGNVMRCGGCGHAMSGVTGPGTTGVTISGGVGRDFGLAQRPRTLADRHSAHHRRAARSDPTHEPQHWHGELEKIERIRIGGYLDQQAEGIISMSELKGKLAALDERRTVAERELEKLTRHQERIAELERGAEALMELYSDQAREGLDLYTPQDRHDVYNAPGIKVIAHLDGSTELTGSVPANLHSDNGRAIPNEEYHALGAPSKASLVGDRRPRRCS